MRLCRDVLKPSGTFWVMINDEHADYFGIMLRKFGFHRRSWVKWYETFGVNCTKKFNRTSRHLFYCVKNPKAFTFNADAIRVPSARLKKYKDARANPKGKLPDDVWAIPRVAGTFKERVKGAKNQLPLELLERIVACSSNPGDLVLDPFLGTGTTGVAAMEYGRKFVGIDSSKEFVEIAKGRILEWGLETFATKGGWFPCEEITPGGSA